MKKLIVAILMSLSVAAFAEEFTWADFEALVEKGFLERSGRNGAVQPVSDLNDSICENIEYLNWYSSLPLSSMVLIFQGLTWPDQRYGFASLFL